MLFPEDVNAKDEFGNCPLYYCSKRFDKEFIDFLLNEKADVNIKCQDGNTPLHLIFKSNDYDYIMKFMNRDGNLNSLNKFK